MTARTLSDQYAHITFFTTVSRYEAALGVITNTSKVVEALYAKSHKLFN